MAEVFLHSVRHWVVSEVSVAKTRSIVILLVLNTSIFVVSSQTETTERYQYEVIYQLGFIWKKAAEATLTLSPKESDTPDLFQAQLIARTVPFADKIFRVRDTLIADMQSDFQPLFYAKITSEDNVYRKDEIVYHRQPGRTIGETTLHRPHRNAIDHATLEADNIPALDMLSLFFTFGHWTFHRPKCINDSRSIFSPGNA